MIVWDWISFGEVISTVEKSRWSSSAMQEDRATGYGPAGGREQPVAPGASCEVLYVDEAARNADDGQQLSNADPADELQTTDVVSGCFVSLSEKSDLRNAAHQQGHNTTTWALKTVSNATDVGRRLAKLAVEVDESFGPEFDSLLDSIATDDANTSKIDYNAMKVILSRLFSGGLSGKFEYEIVFFPDNCKTFVYILFIYGTPHVPTCLPLRSLFMLAELSRNASILFETVEGVCVCVSLII